MNLTRLSKFNDDVDRIVQAAHALESRIREAEEVLSMLGEELGR